MRAFGIVACFSILALAVACGEKPGARSEAPGTGETHDLEALSEATYAAYRAEVLPAASERRWEKVAWHPFYEEGLREASRQGKPVLLWVMNGHPLGCT